MAGNGSTPMSRTELAMLWDLLGRWLASHPRSPFAPSPGASLLHQAVDEELTDRFGG